MKEVEERRRRKRRNKPYVPYKAYSFSYRKNFPISELDHVYLNVAFFVLTFLATELLVIIN